MAVKHLSLTVDQKSITCTFVLLYNHSHGGGGDNVRTAKYLGEMLSFTFNRDPNPNVGPHLSVRINKLQHGNYCTDPNPKKFKPSQLNII
jgi:hypothetical protein